MRSTELCSWAKELGAGKDVVICVSGRGDKDLNTVIQNVHKYYTDRPDVVESVKYMMDNQIGIAAHKH